MAVRIPESSKGCTFVQATEPSVAEPGDTWFNTSNYKTYILRQTGEWQGIAEVRNLGADYGFSCCGIGNGNILTSAIDRIQFPFSSGTSKHVSNLYQSRYRTVGCNSSRYGYTSSGYDQSDRYSAIDRFEFPFDSGISSHVGNLTQSRGLCSSCNCSIYGYVSGGWLTGTSNLVSTVDRFQFPLDLGDASHKGNLSGTRRVTASCNSSSHGFVMGGDSSGSDRVSTIDRFSFPLDSGTASHVGNLTGTRYFMAACNSSHHGYGVGGSNYSAGYIPRSTVDRITFPFNSGTATHVGNLSTTRLGQAGCNSSQYGFSLGGYDDSGTYHSFVSRFQFPFDSGTVNDVGNLSFNVDENAGVDGSDFVTLFV